jgi:hypothetical protein
MTNIADASVGGWVCEGSEQRPMMRTHTCYASLDLAKADGALTLNHGVFLAVRSQLLTRAMMLFCPRAPSSCCLLYLIHTF